jgi:type IX secretion system PorP/SprF family membrane protein
MNPLHINPAFTGAYEGTYRIGGIYRDQYRSVVTRAYSTPAVYIDAPILMIGKRHWIGVGALMFRDQAGDGKLQTNSFQFSGTFHAAMDKKGKNVLTLGLQGGKVRRSLKDGVNAFIFSDENEDHQVNGTPYSSTVSMDDDVFDLNGDPDTSFTDINAGLLFKSKMSKTADFNIGFSVRHITTPMVTLRKKAIGNQPPDLSMRLTAHAQVNAALTDKWSITPEIYYTNLTPASQFQIHGWAGYMLKPEKNIKLNFGLGYRTSDAGQVLLGLDFKDIKAALSYDITLSDLSEANNRRGGFEIALYYIGKIYKKPAVKPAVLCPHL